jgi:hypothetical protein
MAPTSCSSIGLHLLLGTLVSCRTLIQIPFPLIIDVAEKLFIVVYKDVAEGSI